ncbi:MAG: hypothetical protein LUE10_06195, partial [Alistipes sp.]|nr:hypothetical protein [Alistipes sp.]
PPSNIEYEITVTDATSHDMVSNGQYYLGVSNSGVMVYGDETTLDEAFVITTDATAAMGVTTATITATTGITVSPTTINLAETNGGVTTVNATMSASTTSGTATLKVGDLTQTVIFERYSSKRVNFLGLGMELSGGDYIKCEIPAGQSWFKASANGDDPQEGELTLPEAGKMYIMAEINEDASMKSGELFVVRSTNAAQHQRRMKVYLQQGIEPPYSFPTGNTYIGAFWRWNQTGERLIRIQTPSGMQGEWVAWVPEGGDEGSGIQWRNWIKMDTRQSLDPGITRNANDESPDDMILYDSKHQVSGNRTYARGTTSTGGYIEFRIGLNSTLSGIGDEPRYGVIHLYYNDMQKYYTLYLRQGEKEDFLMRRQDNNGNGSISTDWGGTASHPRPKVVQWPVFNLSIEDYRDDPSNTDRYVQIGVEEGVFAKYPTQSGALFKWACHDFPRYAWNPRYSTVHDNFDARNTTETWDVLAVDHEVCPSGYRRPNVGVVNSFLSTISVTNNEVSQSLFLNPPASALGSSSDNVIHGYYADGHFDRYAIVNGVSGSSAYEYGRNSTVSREDLKVANMGTLLYNPFNNASLFIPWSGMREVSNGYISLMGLGGLFWTSASVMVESNMTYGAWAFLVMDGQVRFDDQKRSSAHPLRCIKESPPND